MKISRSFATLAALALSSLPIAAIAADCSVSNSNDAGSGSLRACILQAADGDVVTIEAGVTSPILLTTGALDIDAGLSIVGAGPGVSIIDGSGNGNNRIMTFDASVTGKSASISGVTIRGGNLSADGSAILIDRNHFSLADCVLQGNSATAGNGGAIMVAGAESSLSVEGCRFLDNGVQGAGGNGGAIYSNGTLFINRSVFEGNGTASGQGGKGGAIYLNNGPAQVLGSSFSENSADGDGGAIYNASFNDLFIGNSSFDANRNLNGTGVGGAIYNQRESLIVADSDFTGNTVGGAVFNEGLMDAERCYFSGNSSANFDGGAIQNEHILVLRDSLVIGNSVSPGHGGGVYVNGQALIEGSTIANNSSDFNGGGLYISPGSNVVTIQNSTIWGNEATGNGGGLFAGETLVLNNATIVGNSAASGGGLYTDFETYFGNSLLAGNAAASGPDCFYFAGLFVANGPNLVENPAACTFTGDVQDALNQNPSLAAELADNGGPAIGRDGAQVQLTLALQAGSPALDAGDDASCRPSDQRGVPRPQGAACDLGAFEAGATAELSASNLNFGEEVVGDTSEAQTVSLANNGLIALAIGEIGVDGDADDFTVENDCSASLAPGESCRFTVAFSPTTNALRQATVSVDTSLGQKTIGLLGAGVLPDNNNGGDGGCSLGGASAPHSSALLGATLGLAALFVLRALASRRQD